MSKSEMNKKYKLQLYVQLLKSNTWEVLLQDLRDMKVDAELSRIEPQNEFEAVRNEVRRLERIRTIEKIIDMIESSEKKLSKLR